MVMVEAGGETVEGRQWEPGLSVCGDVVTGGAAG